MNNFKQGRPSSSDRTHIVLTIAKAYERALDVFETPENATIWLTTPNYAFGFRRPIDMLSSPADAEEVFCTMGRIQHGVYS